jgi:hypothetical protein
VYSSSGRRNFGVKIWLEDSEGFVKQSKNDLMTWFSGCTGIDLFEPEKLKLLRADTLMQVAGIGSATSANTLANHHLKKTRHSSSGDRIQICLNRRFRSIFF